MTATILDGKHVAALTEAALTKRVSALKEKSGGRTPVLATILVGDDPASATYVKMKGNACRRIGMESMAIELPGSTRTNDLLRQIEELNANPDVHGILLQHPVPSQIDERAAFDMISLAKDVDGVTCLGFGRMAMGEAAYGCATPQGIMRLLAHYEIPLTGKHAVVIGRSPISGQTHGHDDVGSQCHCNHLPLQNPTASGSHSPGRHHRGRSGSARVHPSGLDQGWRGSCRCGLSPWRRWRYRAGALIGSCYRLYPCARRRWTHDHQHAYSTNRGVRRKSTRTDTVTSAHQYPPIK